MAESLRYHAIRKIADGGSAEVFLGEQKGAAGFARPVVLKRIRPELYADAQYREMLVEEAHLAMSLHHSNLVEVLDVGESAGRYFLVLELVDGWTVQQLMRRARDAGVPLPPELAVYIAAEVCRALAYAHERTQGGQPLAIVHRDVCPNNVMVSMHAEVKLADFGIARARTRTSHTRIGRIKGKPAYMSPEQTRAEPLDARSDLFSVGTVLYALLTSQHPFDAASDQETLVQVSTLEVPSPVTLRPELPKELGQLVLKAMAKKREDRFASAQEMLSALELVQRTTLKPAGRSELEQWLRTLSAKDGATAITQQPMPPVAVVSGEPEWIALSSEQYAPPRLPLFPTPTPKPRSRTPEIAAGLVVVLAIGLAAGWWLGRRDRPTETLKGFVAADEPSKLDEDDLGGEWVTPDLTADEDAGSGPAGPKSRSGSAGLRLAARLAPGQKPGASMVAVNFESEPSGVVVKVDKKELGKTPVTLRFKSGLTFDVWFEVKGKAPVRQWLMLTPREGQLPKVTLRNPVP